jgi:3-oxoacyl-[acyl-carrier protein] reductase
LISGYRQEPGVLRMDLGIRDKVALVAGGSRGCGLGIAQELAREGAAIVISGRGHDAVEEAVASIRETGARAHGVVADMSNEAQACRIVEEARSAFGPPDILVVNPRPASVVQGFDAIDDDAMRDSYETWVMSLVHLARPLLPDMVARKWGRIIYMGSIGLKMLHLDDPMYAQNTRVAAAAVIKTLSHEYGKFGITANTIATGPFMSELALSYMAKQGALTEEHMLAMTALGRWGTPEEMGAVVTFLCSTRASYVSGETIRVDGGYTHNLF